MTREDFDVGDRVQHMRGAIGTVSKITRETIHVTFDADKSWRGEYDDLWFQIYPNGLRKITPTDTGSVT